MHLDFARALVAAGIEFNQMASRDQGERPTAATAVGDDAAQRRLHGIFRELNAILDVFPSKVWSPEDAQAVVDALGRRFYLHETQKADEAI